MAWRLDTWSWRRLIGGAVYRDLAVTVEPLMSFPSGIEAPAFVSKFVVRVGEADVAFAGLTRCSGLQWLFFNVHEEPIGYADIAEKVARSGQYYLSRHGWLRDLERFLQAVPDLLELGVLSCGHQQGHD